MLDGKEINETAKQFLMNWKANREARRRQQKQQHQLYLEGAGSTNAVSSGQLSSGFSSVPTLPAIQGPPSHSGYALNAGINPVFDGQELTASMQGLTLHKNSKGFMAVMQARAPHSTLLTKKPIEDISQSCFPNIFSPARNIAVEPTWEAAENDTHNGPPLPLKT